MERFLIIKISSLGDVLHAFPAVSLIRRKFPDAKIDWLVNPSFAPVLEYNKDVSGILKFPRKELGSPLSFPGAFSTLVSRIRREKYDMVIDLQGLFRSAFFAKFARSPEVAGFASPREKLSALLYNRKISPEPEYVHAVEKNARLVSILLDIPFSVPDTLLPVNSANKGKLDSLLAGKGIAQDEILVGVAPGARWESKQWPPEFFAEVVEKVGASVEKCRFLLLGSPDELEACRKIASVCLKARTTVIAGETGIGELVEAIRMSKCLLCNDSGPMHIAACLHVPAFAFFGPTDPDKTGPYGKGHTVFKPDMSCIKCFKRYCPQRNNLCHKSIDSSSVAEGVISLLR
ncbi:MAG TPA: lipopolysaccharide heptosyltransferase II [Lentisphaeria bacterium]|nr:MAG: lipopolysaccharide heptosyltransferase II [Lentisphaerae bacterium GWF2_49_21]HBC85967.1 lipopolysaccharide heptosyltransferase II [Lentisphaeria bacterium]